MRIRESRVNLGDFERFYLKMVKMVTFSILVNICEIYMDREYIYMYVYDISKQ